MRTVVKFEEFWSKVRKFAQPLFPPSSKSFESIWTEDSSIVSLPTANFYPNTDQGAICCVSVAVDVAERHCLISWPSSKYMLADAMAYSCCIQQAVELAARLESFMQKYEIE